MSEETDREVNRHIAAHQCAQSADVHKDTWRGKGDAYWLARLMQEVGELSAALVNDHEHPPEWELRQIGSIAINWLALRYEITRDSNDEDEPFVFPRFEGKYSARPGPEESQPEVTGLREYLPDASTMRVSLEDIRDEIEGLRKALQQPFPAEKMDVEIRLMPEAEALRKAVRKKKTDEREGAGGAEENELKPCPFCGAKAGTVWNNGVEIRCLGNRCYVEPRVRMGAGVVHARARAVEIWNRREGDEG